MFFLSRILKKGNPTAARSASRVLEFKCTKRGAHCEEDSRMRRLVLLSTSQIWRPKPNGKAGDC